MISKLLKFDPENYLENFDILSSVAKLNSLFWFETLLGVLQFTFYLDLKEVEVRKFDVSFYEFRPGIRGNYYSLNEILDFVY